MPYTITFLEDEKIVVIQNIGKLSPEEFEKQNKEAYALSQTKDSLLCLVDNTQIAPSISTLDLYSYPDIYEKLDIPKTIRVAVILPEDTVTRGNIRFWETVCINRGWTVKIFNTKNEAIDWLLS